MSWVVHRSMHASRDLYGNGAPRHRTRPPVIPHVGHACEEHLEKRALDVILGVPERAIAMSDNQRDSDWPLPGTVLVVDHDETLRRSHYALLEGAGCICHAAGSYREALALVECQWEICLVIAGVNAQAADMEEFTATLRQQHPGVIIVATSKTDCRAELGAFGVDRFLKGRWQIEDLIMLLSARITECTACGLSVPLRKPFPGEVAGSWVCCSCGERYRAVLDHDAPADTFRNVRPSDVG